MLKKVIPWFLVSLITRLIQSIDFKQNFPRWHAVISPLLWLVHTARDREQDREREMMGFYIMLCAVHTHSDRDRNRELLLPPATKLGQGNIFRSVCHEFCPRGGGACMAGGMHGRGACMGGMCGRGACVAGGHAWWGCMHAMHVPPTPRDMVGQCAGGMHPTGMHSCFLLCQSQSLSLSCSWSHVVCMNH